MSLYNRMKFMLRPNKTSAALAGKVVDIYDFPDGRLEIRWKGLPLSYSVFDHLQRQPRGHHREQASRRSAGLDQAAAGQATPLSRQPSRSQAVEPESRPDEGR
jgi:hypothetical protein